MSLKRGCTKGVSLWKNVYSKKYLLISSILFAQVDFEQSKIEGRLIVKPGVDEELDESTSSQISCFQSDREKLTFIYNLEKKTLLAFLRMSPMTQNVTLESSFIP